MTKKESKSQAALLKDQLMIEPKNSGSLMPDKQIQKAFDFCEEYKKFLNSAKTEIESVDYVLSKLKKRGYTEFDPQKKYAAGDMVYVNNRGRSLLFAVIGNKPLTDGVKIIASHVDCPRIDLKSRPLYEESQLAMLKTHYYGGIRKYQWVATPLALHGVISKKDGEVLPIVIGENDSDPVLCINDLLPHLAREQYQRKLSEGIKGEELNVLVGSLPFKTEEDDKTTEKVKLNIMRLLNEKYGIGESDCLSADLSLVPAFKARAVGFDLSMVGGYGHDDRVCAYTSVMASFDAQKPEYTWINILADKEETGSDGATGLNSRFLEYFVHDLARPYGISGSTVLQNSECISADVSVAFDPTFPDVTEKRNTSYLSYGVCLVKYTGSRGKSGTSEATAEFTGKMRRLFDENGIIWQTGELGKVDAGGGGTVAMFIAKLGVNVVDIGVPVLSMHSPFEVVSKTDVYNTYLAFKAFLSQG